MRSRDLKDIWLGFDALTFFNQVMDLFFKFLIFFVVLILGLVCLSFPPLTDAQDLPKQSQSAEPTKLSDKDLIVFAKAYVAYQKLRQTYEPRLGKIQDPKEKQKLQQEGDAKVIEALEQHGLTPQSYNRLFAAVNGNEQLRQKALKLINEERSRS
jgi:hypothetical protein